MVVLAESLPAVLPRFYVERFDALSPVERQLLQALSLRTEVIVRVRDVVEAPAIEQQFRPMVEQLIAAGEWTGSQDPPPSDAAVRQARAEVLLGAGAPPLPRVDRVRYQRFSSVDEELAGVAARPRALLERGLIGFNIVVALPDCPSYRTRAAALRGLPLQMHYPAVGAPAHDPAGIRVVAHADLAGRVAMCVVIAGVEGAVDGEPAAGGFRASPPRSCPATCSMRSSGSPIRCGFRPSWVRARSSGRGFCAPVEGHSPTGARRCSSGARTVQEWRLNSRASVGLVFRRSAGWPRPAGWQVVRPMLSQRSSSRVGETLLHGRWSSSLTQGEC